MLVVANITLSGNGVALATQADDSGHYAFEDLPPGKYNIVVGAGGKQNKAGGFAKTNIEVGAGATGPVVLNILLTKDPDELRHQE